MFLYIIVKFNEELYRVTSIFWGISSVGRAPALHAGGQEFESPILHSILFSAAVAQLTVNQLVPGSNPGRGVWGSIKDL